MPNTLPPHPDRPKRGQKIHPIDIQISETVRAYPGQRTIYPVDYRWPNEDHTTPEGIRRAANRIRSRLNIRWGAYAATESGRFKIKSEPKNLRIYIWYEPNE